MRLLYSTISLYKHFANGFVQKIYEAVLHFIFRSIIKKREKEDDYDLWIRIKKKVNYRLAWKISKRVENIVFFTFLVLALLFLFVLYPMAKQDMIVGIIGICCAFFVYLWQLLKLVSHFTLPVSR